ncbi:unnamed protein product, partial [Polarella glacialis]
VVVWREALRSHQERLRKRQQTIAMVEGAAAAVLQQTLTDWALLSKDARLDEKKAELAKTSAARARSRKVAFVSNLTQSAMEDGACLQRVLAGWCQYKKGRAMQEKRQAHRMEAMYMRLEGDRIQLLTSVLTAWAGWKCAHEAAEKKWRATVARSWDVNGQGALIAAWGGWQGRQQLRKRKRQAEQQALKHIAAAQQDLVATVLASWHRGTAAALRERLGEQAQAMQASASAAVAASQERALAAMKRHLCALGAQLRVTAWQAFCVAVEQRQARDESKARVEQRRANADGELLQEVVRDWRGTTAKTRLERQLQDLNEKQELEQEKMRKQLADAQEERKANVMRQLRKSLGATRDLSFMAWQQAVDLTKNERVQKALKLAVVEKAILTSLEGLQKECLSAWAKLSFATKAEARNSRSKTLMQWQMAESNTQLIGSSFCGWHNMVKDARMHLQRTDDNSARVLRKSGDTALKQCIAWWVADSVESRLSRELSEVKFQLEEARQTLGKSATSMEANHARQVAAFSRHFALAGASLAGKCWEGWKKVVHDRTVKNHNLAIAQRGIAVNSLALEKDVLLAWAQEVKREKALHARQRSRAALERRLAASAKQLLHSTKRCSKSQFMLSCLLFALLFAC